jgi:hypothetical protein
VDIGLYSRVIWRFRFLVAAGALLGIILAMLSFFRLDFSDGFPRAEYREPEAWSSTARLFLTQEGSPWIRTVDPLVPATSRKDGPLVPAFADSDRFADLAVLYAELAKGDQVRELALTGETRGDVSFTAAPVVPEDDPLPLIEITSSAHSAGAADAVAVRAAEALKVYVERQQVDARVPSNQRVVLELVERPEAYLVEGRSKTLPAVIFLTVLLAAVGLAFALENLGQRFRVLPALSEDVAEPGSGEVPIADRISRAISAPTRVDRAQQ